MHKVWIHIGVFFVIIMRACQLSASPSDLSNRDNYRQYTIPQVKVTDSKLLDFLTSQVIQHAIQNEMVSDDYDIYVRNVHRDFSEPKDQLSIALEKNQGRILSGASFHTMINGYNVFFDWNCFRLGLSHIPGIKEFQYVVSLSEEYSSNKCDQWIIDYRRDWDLSRTVFLDTTEQLGVPSLEYRLADTYRKCRTPVKIEDDPENPYYSEGLIELPKVKITEPTIVSILDSIISNYAIPAGKDPKKFDVYIRLSNLASPLFFTEADQGITFNIEDTEHTIYGNISSVTEHKGYNVYMNNAFTNKYTLPEKDSIEVAISHSESRRMPTVSSIFQYSLSNNLDIGEKPKISFIKEYLDYPGSREHKIFKYYFIPITDDPYF